MELQHFFLMLPLTTFLHFNFEKILVSTSFINLHEFKLA